MSLWQKKKERGKQTTSILRVLQKVSGKKLETSVEIIVHKLPSL